MLYERDNITLFVTLFLLTYVTSIRSTMNFFYNLKCEKSLQKYNIMILLYKEWSRNYKQKAQHGGNIDARYILNFKIINYLDYHIIVRAIINSHTSKKRKYFI